MSVYVEHSRNGTLSQFKVSLAYSTNIELDADAELNEFSEQVCKSYLVYGDDCYSKEHAKISDDDFAHCDVIVVVSENEQKEFMMENYKQYADKMKFGASKKSKVMKSKRR